MVVSLSLIDVYAMTPPNQNSHSYTGFDMIDISDNSEIGSLHFDMPGKTGTSDKSGKSCSFHSYPRCCHILSAYPVLPAAGRYGTFS